MPPSGTTVLVTGASGFLGGRLAQMLVERGNAVRVLARGSSDLRHLSHLPLQIVRGDLNDVAALDEAVRGARMIYHCAACSMDWVQQRLTSRPTWRVRRTAGGGDSRGRRGADPACEHDGCLWLSPCAVRTRVGRCAMRDGLTTGRRSRAKRRCGARIVNTDCR